MPSGRLFDTGPLVFCPQTAAYTLYGSPVPWQMGTGVMDVWLWGCTSFFALREISRSRNGKSFSKGEGLPDLEDRVCL